VRGLFDVHDANSPRMDLGVEQFVTGLGFVFENVWFRRKGETLLCAAISPWHGPGLSEVQALDLVAGGREALAYLLTTSGAFADAVAELDPRFLIIRDDEISSDVIAEMVGDRLEWRPHGPSAPAD
jgi:hypothetical protein